jgi:hypothetical protein
MRPNEARILRYGESASEESMAQNARPFILERCTGHLSSRSALLSARGDVVLIT